MMDAGRFDRNALSFYLSYTRAVPLRNTMMDMIESNLKSLTLAMYLTTLNCR